MFIILQIYYLNKLHLLKKAENLIKDYTNFYVKRITPKNEFNLDRIIFE